MPTSYPTAIDTFPANGTNLGSAPTHANMHTNIQDAVRAVQNELGTNPSLGYATVAAAMTDLTRLGVKARAVQTNTQTGIGNTYVDLTGLSVSFNAVDGRLYKITGYGRVAQYTNPGRVTIIITDGANNQIASFQETLTVDQVAQGVAMTLVSPSAGFVTYKLRMLTTAGTCDFVALPTSPAFLLVEDIGSA
jgi:hypothetical protein